ncbi:MAG: hypothetical protein HWN80_09420 [Candidatus Lokiarchaeota archaeon]|nr:hypothetical protein [Candidatus Lokiarchaeota archaeon]
MAAPRGIFLEKAILHPNRTPIPPQDNWVSSLLVDIKFLKPSVWDHPDRRGP